MINRAFFVSQSAGKDATKAFFGLHRHEVLLRPQYKRLQIGTLKDSSEVVKASTPVALSAVPFAEPTWLSKGFHSPYYTEGHRRFQRAMRRFVSEVISPEMEKCELSGKYIGKDVVQKMS